MANISRKAVRELVKGSFGFNLTSEGADEIAGIIEKEAKRISAFAVQNAKKREGGKVTRSDIREYAIKNGSHGQR
ncbi:MAG: hypothetical protein KGH72_00980 [Candidatus Micrarchaeota archaeon]|nr:hypothetical protein [Candidatus Micrarchaeota archaeon]